MPSEPLELRAHQVLCLQGFRGAGYSAGFVAEMGAVHRRLGADPDQPVRLTVTPDRLCAACPHLAADGCTLQGPGHEAHMRAQDEAVLRRLGLLPGDTLPWRAVLGRIAATTQGADLPALCTTCPWLPLGWCRDAMDRLAAGPGE